MVKREQYTAVWDAGGWISTLLWYGARLMKDVIDGIEVIKGRLKALPSTPGVYRMLGQDGAVLYVGKAKNIGRRVTSYTQPERMVTRIRKMVFETRDLVVVETRTEAEALLLEANLIKSLKPKYNILFRDDASYVSVVITGDETPLIRAHRGAKRKGDDYFGPYPSAQAVYQTLDLMERAFRLRTCSDGVFYHRTRPCLKYDIKRCSGPCVGRIPAADYAQTVNDAKKFLRGERGVVLEALQAQMQAASARMDFEAAAGFRDRIKALSAVSGASSAVTHALADADVFALVVVHGKVAVQGFFYRNGAHVGNQTYFPRMAEDEVAEPSEVMRLFIAQHYAGRAVPPRVCVNVAPADADMLEEALGLSVGRKVAIEVPQRGDKAAIVAQAEHNAKQALARKVSEGANWSAQMAELGAMIGYDLSGEDVTVECYDISNISGKFPVASCVVAGRDGMLKQRYRRYNVKSKDTPDDFGMLREVLGRRVKRGLQEGLPDVFLIDGGKGQLNVLVDVIRDAGLLGAEHCPALCSIAKGEERDKGLEVIWHAVADNDGEVTLRTLPVAFNSPLKFVLQQIRDEAHRFAITFHRAKRSKGQTRSKLDAIGGIGPKRKKALLLHFGSPAAVEGASVADLCRVEGVSEALAQAIYDALHG